HSFINADLVSADGTRYGRGAPSHSLSPAENEPPGLTSFENCDQQLRVSPDGDVFAFQNFLRVANEWRPATLPGISLVTGPSFPLRATGISKSGSGLNCEGSASAEDLNGKSFSYSWEANISTQNP